MMNFERFFDVITPTAAMLAPEIIDPGKLAPETAARVGADGRTMGERVAEAHQDLIRIAAGWAPDAQLLAEAPVIIEASAICVLRRCVTLAGIGLGHPTIADGPLETSVVVALSVDGTWARTVSRFYRIGSVALPLRGQPTLGGMPVIGVPGAPG